MTMRPVQHPAPGPAGGASSRAGAAAPQTRRVTDAPMRMFHALFAFSFAGAWLTAESEHGRLLHVTLGYTFGALLVFRVLYGLLGPRLGPKTAGLGALWRRAAGAPAWARAVTVALRNGQRPPWRQGQNMALAMVLVALLALAPPLVLSGWAVYNDLGDVFEDLHESLGDAAGALVMVHVGLIAALSLWRRQNLALPMLTGRVIGTGPNLVQHNRGWLALGLLAGTLALAAWLWQGGAAA
jgi:cytochrome b